jgi:hypothetical protein
VNKVLTETLLALTNKEIPLEEFAHKPESLPDKLLGWKAKRIERLNFRFATCQRRLLLKERDDMTKQISLNPKLIC